MAGRGWRAAVRNERWWWGLLANLAVVTFAFIAGREWSDPAEISVVRGVARVDTKGTGIRLADLPEEDAVYMVGTGVSWWGTNDHHHGTGQPECLPPGSEGAEVELGVIPEVEGGYRNEVVWVRCITLPTGFWSEQTLPPDLMDNYEDAIQREQE